MDRVDTILSNYRKIMKSREDYVSEEEYAEIKKKYKITDPRRLCGHKLHCEICEEASKLATNVIYDGRTKDEVILIIKYLMVCMDAEKHQLDWLKFRIDNGIPELSQKYGVAERTKGMDIPE